MKRCSLKQAQKRLRQARAEAGVLRQEIAALRDHIRTLGRDPDAPEVDLLPRNIIIYRKRRNGVTYAALAQEYGLQPNYVAALCHRITKILGRQQHRHYAVYKVLLKDGPALPHRRRT